MSGKILITKLVGDVEIIGTTEETDSHVVIENPFYIFLNQSNGQKDVIMSEYLPMGKERKAKIPNKDVSFTYEPAEKLEQKYRELFGSKLILPTKTLLTE